MLVELCVILVMESKRTVKQVITNCRLTHVLTFLLVWRRFKKCSRVLLGILFVCGLYTLVKLELWVAETKVGYLNNQCELSEDQLDQFRTVVTTYAKLLEETNQTYWLDFGTLLGAYRCNDVLPHDGDADISRIANWSKSEDRILTNKLAVRLKNAIGAKLTKYIITYKNVSVDIFTWKRNKTKLENFYGVHDNQPAIPENLVFPLKTTNFSGYQLSVPNQITEMLKFRYPFSGPSIVVSYKWRCYLKRIATLGLRPPRCPLPSRNMKTVSEAVANITKGSARKIS